MFNQEIVLWHFQIECTHISLTCVLNHFVLAGKKISVSIYFNNCSTISANMLKNILLLVLVSCTLLASVQAMSDMMDRLKDRVIHVETLQQRGRWLKQIDNQDKDGNRYLYVDELAERDTYYTPRVQFQVSVGRASKLNWRLTEEKISWLSHDSMQHLTFQW